MSAKFLTLFRVRCHQQANCYFILLFWTAQALSWQQPSEDVSTPGHTGRGRGPLDTSSAKQDEGDNGRGRSERSERSSDEGWLPGSSEPSLQK